MEFKYTKTILNGIKVWIEKRFETINSSIEDIKTWANDTFLSYKPQTLTANEQEQVRINIGETEDTAMELAFDIGLVEPMTDDEGYILTDENDNILSN